MNIILSNSGKIWFYEGFDGENEPWAFTLLALIKNGLNGKKPI